MRSTVSSRIMFSLTLIATMAMVCSSSFARGRGGRAGGGRSGQSASKRSAPARSGNAAAGSKNLAGQVGNLSTAAGGLSSKAGGLNTKLSDKSQLQGLIQQQSGKLSSGLSSRDGQFQSQAQNATSQFQNRAQPFTPAWYADHPNAWQHTHPHADAAVVASTAAVAAWLGTGYYTPTSSGTTVIYEEAPAEEVVADQVPGTVAANVAPSGTALNSDEWFQIGIYALAANKNTSALQMVQLVVNHQGNLRGVYYDSITDTSHNIEGAVDRQTQSAEWRLESSEHVVFQTNLDELTQSSGTVKVALPAGPQQWQITRVDNSK